MDSDTDLFDAIETARLRLRCARSGDAAQISEMMVPSVSRWVASWPIPFTPGMAAERIADSRRAFLDGRALACVIERRIGGVLLGWISVVRRDASDRRAMMGYWMGEAHHGHGYMREAAPAAVALAFSSLGLDVIEAAAQPENKASLAVLRGCGMMPVGERAIFAPARARDELCVLYEVEKTSIQTGRDVR